MTTRERREAAIRRRLGREIAARAAALRIAPTALAEAAEIDDRQMARVFRGRAGLSIYSLIRVAAVLGCSPGDLLNASLSGPRVRGGASETASEIPNHS
jgi:plasmid maintenance system antidote protein VapI